MSDSREPVPVTDEMVQAAIDAYDVEPPFPMHAALEAALRVVPRDADLEAASSGHDDGAAEALCVPMRELAKQSEAHSDAPEFYDLRDAGDLTFFEIARDMLSGLPAGWALVRVPQQEDQR